MDHGAWVPLRRLDPEATTPVVQLGVGAGDARAHHRARPRPRSWLTNGVQLLASGAITHALADIRDWRETDADHPSRGSTAFLARWTLESQSAIWRHCSTGNVRRTHAATIPTPEHLMPLFVALGAARDDSWPRSCIAASRAEARDGHLGPGRRLDRRRGGHRKHAGRDRGGNDRTGKSSSGT